MRMKGRDGGRMRNGEWGMRRDVRGRKEKAKEKGSEGDERERRAVKLEREKILFEKREKWGGEKQRGRKEEVGGKDLRAHRRGTL